MKKKNYLWKIHRNSDLILGTPLMFTLLIVFILFAVNIREHSKFLSIIIAVIMLLAITYYMYVTLWSWNTAIYFDEEKIWQRYKGKDYVWFWKDIKSIDRTKENSLRFILRIPLMILIKSDSTEKQLSFSWNSCREKKFLRICPDERIKELFKKACK